MTITQELIEQGHTALGGVCEKCWEIAFLRSLEDGQPQGDHYRSVVDDAESGRLSRKEPSE